ncbi:putative L-type lectin-domain containing receptor kinase S.5 [Dorcoceras hygrometricum]|uniref:non-specific serine/threonine protein kinase n=1 Tax=Dorcoceras hygrometricum TaxID=472368 RepID=A0A2Z7CAQ2_9LAMI|nr:putative L-type lectin-domain containing receptor kinase S.5 [Dorcoceras hygrometricum]
MANLIVATIAILSFVSSINSAEAQELETFQQQYGPFNETSYGIFEVVRSATINNDALQVTPESASADFNMYNNSGRVILNRSFKLWDGNNTASFNTSFLVNIYRPKNDTPGEGVAFVIAPDKLLPPNSFGKFLGLTNSSTDGNATNKIVAVELDTFKQDFDPDDNHVGLDLNSVRSVRTEPLGIHNITLAPMGARFYNVWIDYNGTTKVIEVYIGEQETKTGPTPAKPSSPILRVDNLDLREAVNQNSYFGFSASTGNVTQLNCILRWNLTVHHFPEAKSRWMKIAVGAGVPALVLLLSGAAWFWYYLHKRQMVNSKRSLLGALKSLPGTPREFKYRDLKKATHDFDDKNKLGEGGYGVVYRGLLAKEDLEIAVKCFSRGSIKGEDDFLAELTIINRLRHKHLVKLLGWCHKNGKLLLVYEYMPNGSLDMHLFAGPDVGPLEWSVRYKVISGVASALHYLHNEYEQRVVHRDLKASNIMLDSKFDARLGDFGLARALENEKTSYAEAQGVLGTMGYIAPECFHTGKATQQSDVYAFGAVVLEVVCGRRPGTKIGGYQSLVDWVWSLHREGRLLEAVDPRLGEVFVAEEAERLLLLGLACSHPNAYDRPKTQDIFQMITSSNMPVPVVPPFRPSFVWPAGGPINLDSSSACSTSQYLSKESDTGHTDSLV